MKVFLGNCYRLDLPQHLKKKKKSETETHYVFEKKLVGEHPHGELTPFMSIGGFQKFAHDEAGRTWVAEFGSPYELFDEKKAYKCV